MSGEKYATMSMSQKSRSAVYAGLVELLGEEPVEEMLSHFPLNEAGEAITKSDLKVELGVLRQEMGEMRSELRLEMGEMRSELRHEIAELRTELQRQHNRLMLFMATVTGIATAIITAAVTLAH
jgi:hypothetical protein